MNHCIALLGIVYCAALPCCTGAEPSLVIYDFEQAAVRQREMELDLKRWNTAWWLQKRPTQFVVKLAEELHTKWKDAGDRENVELMQDVAIVLFSQTQGDEAALRAALGIAQDVIGRVPNVRVDLGDLTLTRINAAVIGSRSGSKSLLDALDRRLALDGFLGVIGRVETFFETLEAPPQGFFNMRPDPPPGVSSIDGMPMGPILDPKDQAAYAANIVNWMRKADTHTVYHQFSPGGLGRREGLQRDFARYVQKHFMLMPEDLDILEPVFDKHIRNPELKERLILKCFNGVNPFLDRPGRKEASAAGKPSDVRSRIEAQMRGTAGGSAPGAAAGSGAAHSPAGGAQTGVGVQPGSTALAVAFGALGFGAIAFIVLRARSRRNP